MQHTIYKAFSIAAYEKEEQWLNELSAKGMQLVSVGFCRYTFEEGEPGEYAYRLELLEHRAGHPESVAYIRFMEEMGVKHVATYLRWVYFRKKKDGEAFDIYSDLDSKIKHYDRIFSLAAAVFCLNLFAVILNADIHVVYFATNGRLHGSPFAGNAMLGSINLALSIILGIFMIRIYRRKKKLKYEKRYRE